ncbi:MAG: aspartate--tRNA ligase, partial [Actinomycetota bacterium]
MLRTHRCGDLRADHVGDTVTLCGWVHTRRDHGGVIFIDLRDVAGLVQVVFNASVSQAAYETGESLRSEFCIKVTGEVRARPQGTINDKIGTGEVEVAASSVEIFSRSETPPFQVDEHLEHGEATGTVDETLRLKHRYLDLRKERMQRNLQMRHRIISAIRRFYDSEGFTEVETPMLGRATPEGARDYLVPSRVHPGTFYALPQSPQLHKQILMVAGLDRYYQIVRCFRDEDLRADRQPDFTQLDLEMSFVEVDDVLESTERMFKSVWREVLGVELGEFVRIPYGESMERFGSDKPDLRYGMELKDLGDTFAATEVKVFRSVLDGGGLVKAIVVEGQGGLARKDLDGLVDQAKALGAGGLVWIGVTPDGFKSPLDKFFTEDERAGLLKATGATEGDLVLVVA